MHYIPGDILATWGQIAAIILAIYMFVNILIGLAFALGVSVLFAWIREKANLVKKLRPAVDDLNRTIETPPDQALPVTVPQDNKILQIVHKAQGIDVTQKAEMVEHTAQNVEKKVDQGADKVAQAVIEFRARTMMVKAMAKAFFLPGLKEVPPAEPMPLIGESPLQRGIRFDESVNRQDSGPAYSPEETSNAVVAKPSLPDRVEDAQIQTAGRRPQG
ncbi:MAG TPA: hypothetical protein VFA41_06510 [Ktedonobacteraceae bacterium]|jgi:hypothetical protein|nr:hypothetical protein [Ktedonobacteraceae bacterium]